MKIFGVTFSSGMTALQELASLPRKTRGMRHSAATGSAHVIPQKAFTTRPARAMIDKYPQSTDSAASALKAAVIETFSRLLRLNHCRS
jgi:hypothetical protein